MMPVSGSGMMSTKRPCMLPERIKTENNNLIECGCAIARAPAAACGRRPWAGRAEITGSREGAKPRSSGERRTFFPRALGPRRKSRQQAKAIRGHSRRPPGGPGKHDNRSGSGGRQGLRAMCPGLRQGQLSGERDWESNVFGSLLLLTDNNIHQLRIKPQRHEGTKDAQKFDAVYSFVILAGYRPQGRALRRSGSGGTRGRLWAGSSGIAAMSSGLAGLPDKRSRWRQGARAGLRSGEDGSRSAAFSRLFFGK
jgi:hypothetical protein